MKVNPAAVLIAVFAALIGYLINGVDGAVWGATIMIGFGLVLSLF